MPILHTRIHWYLLVLAICAAFTSGAGSSAPATIDDSTQLQLAVNAAIKSRERVILRSGEYRLSSTIKFAPLPGQRSLIGLTVEGSGPDNTVLKWEGPANRSMFEFVGTKYGLIQGFSMRGKPALSDLQFMGNGSAGGMEIANVLFDNAAQFSVRVGAPADYSPVSELSFRNVYSWHATVASFELEGYNTLNISFFNCGCAHVPVCVSNAIGLDTTGIGQDGGNFNWYGGSISDSPDSAGDDHHTTFDLATGNTYNFVGLRVEDSGTLFSTSPSAAAIMINWIGGWYLNSTNHDANTRIVDYRAGGSFGSSRSLWGTPGSFYFGPNTKSARFSGDMFRLGWGHNPNIAIKQYFRLVPKQSVLRIEDGSDF